MTKQKDNSTFDHKVALRRHALQRLGVERPVVMETHGGMGALFDAVYAHLPVGVVFEKQPERTARLAKQRPTWAVYECDCAAALAGGVGGHVPVDLLDVDPWGSPWVAISSFFGSQRPFAARMMVAVNDGVREHLQLKGAWRSPFLHAAVERYGNDLYPIYLEVCRDLMEAAVSQTGYALAHFGGYYCGVRSKMTHYLAELVKEG